MEQTLSEKKSIFATQPVGKLILKFSVPCVISLVVNALYNIVDQIFIGWGVGYLGNGATNVVFPITIIALALAVLVGDGAAAFFSLKLGEGDKESVKKGVGNAIVLVTVAGLLVLVIFLACFNPILRLFGATDLLLPYAQDYGWIIAIGLPFTMISTAINAMIRVDGSPRYAMFSMVLGAVINIALDALFILVFKWGVTGAAIATVLGQVASFGVSVRYVFKLKTVKLGKDDLKLNAKICADYILRGKADCLKVFIHADKDVRAQRIVDVYGESSVSIDQRIKDKDKRRAAYHRFYTNMKWGDAKNYDVTLNSGTLGIDACVSIIKQLY